MNMSEIGALCEANALRWTHHAMVRLLQRNIDMDIVIAAMMCGEIIEQYPDDYPYPSCLVLGAASEDKPMHIVCAIGDAELWIITAYWPDDSEWDAEYRNRKG